MDISVVDMIVHVEETIPAEKMHELEDVVRTDACIISACSSNENPHRDLQSRVHEFRQCLAYGSGARRSCESGRALVNTFAAASPPDPRCCGVARKSARSQYLAGRPISGPFWQGAIPPWTG